MIYSVDNLAFYNLSMYYKMESQSLDFSTAPEDKGLVKDIVKAVVPIVIKAVLK